MLLAATVQRCQSVQPKPQLRWTIVHQMLSRRSCPCHPRCSDSSSLVDLYPCRPSLPTRSSPRPQSARRCAVDCAAPMGTSAKRSKIVHHRPLYDQHSRILLAVPRPAPHAGLNTYVLCCDRSQDAQLLFGSGLGTWHDMRCASWLGSCCCAQPAFSRSRRSAVRGGRQCNWDPTLAPIRILQSSTAV